MPRVGDGDGRDGTVRDCSAMEWSAMMGGRGGEEEGTIVVEG